MVEIRKQNVSAFRYGTEKRRVIIINTTNSATLAQDVLKWHEKLCLICLQQEALIVVVPNDFIFVVGRYVFQTEIGFGFYFAFYFVICKIIRTEVAVMLMCCFLNSSYCQEFIPVYFILKFPKPREFKTIAGMTENDDFIEQNLPWRFSSRNIFLVLFAAWSFC